MLLCVRCTNFEKENDCEKEHHQSFCFDVCGCGIWSVAQHGTRRVCAEREFIDDDDELEQQRCEAPPTATAPAEASRNT